MKRPGLQATIVLVLLAAPQSSFAIQAGSAADTVTIVAGERYRAGGLHRWLLGSDYRDLWTTPIRVPILDLDRFAGGLTPTTTGGGFQTRSLRFAAADGTEYAFRSVDKDPSSILPPDLRETLVDNVIQDQISSGHPVGALVAVPVLEAVRVLHPDPQLYVMPDDPRLGEFRAEFAGMLGLIEVRPDEGEEGEAGFMGANQVIGTERVLERREEDVERIDAPAFLAARLVDAFLGDWDRHRDQWRWAQFAASGDSSWKAVPRDRDQAFVRMDGLMLALARQYFPQLVRFDADYPSTLGISWNGRELDRLLLAGLEWPVWDSVATVLQHQITDGVIDQAVARMPPEYVAIQGETMRMALRARRDALPRFARSFYELLAGVVEVHTTDAPEIAEVQRISDSELHVVVRARVRGAMVPVYERTLLAGETDELRLDLHGGADTAWVTGSGGVRIRIRVLGGGGDDVLIDESGGARFYDTSGDNTFVRTAGTRVNERPYEYRGPPFPPSQPPRDWGHQYRYPLWVAFAPDVGALVGLAVERFGYGFRSWPYNSRMRVRAAFGTTARAFRAEVDGELYRQNSGTRFTLSARGSGLEVLRFYGYGNETADDGPEEAFKVDQREFAIESRMVIPLGAKSRFSFGPTLRSTTTEEGPDRPTLENPPYGWGTFRQVGLFADLLLDGRDRVKAASRGASLAVGGALHPAIWDANQAFAELNTTATAFLTAPIPLAPTLAVRVGARKVWGEVPFSDAAFLGDATTVRLGLKQRYAGDAEAHANAELRLKLARAVLVLPADFGIFGLVDTGRVWYGDESSERWHRSAGGGIWLAFLRPENTFSMAVVSAEGRTGVYVGAGFAF